MLNSDFTFKKWWAMQVSNLRPSVCKTDALTAELIAHMARLAGLEPAALASAGVRSIQLSYKRVF